MHIVKLIISKLLLVKFCLLVITALLTIIYDEVMCLPVFLIDLS